MPQFNSAAYPKSKCKTCGKPIVVMTTRGRKSLGYCNRVCESLAKFEKRYTGMRSGEFDKPKDLMKKATS